MKKDKNYGTCRQNKDEQILQRQSTGCNCRAHELIELLFHWGYMYMSAVDVHACDYDSGCPEGYHETLLIPQNSGIFWNSWYITLLYVFLVSVYHVALFMFQKPMPS